MEGVLQEETKEIYRLQIILAGTRQKQNNIRKGEVSATKEGERGETLQRCTGSCFRDVRGVEGRYWNESVFARPNGLRKKAETAISCRGPGPTRKKEMYQ